MSHPSQLCRVEGTPPHAQQPQLLLGSQLDRSKSTSQGPDMHGSHVWHACRLHARQTFLPAGESRPLQQRITDVVYRQLLLSTHACDEAVWY